MEKIKLNDRLITAVGFVREGARFADVGTDHAYLPIYLMSMGRIESAIASDINRGPLERAQENIEKYGFSKKIKTVLCDGLSKVEEYDPTDIAIFGLGGELIVKIIDEANWLRDQSRRKRIILQPMTHTEKVREYLAREGFCVVDEMLSYDRGKIYQTICAEYDGISRSFDVLTLTLGEHIIKKGGKLFLELAKTLKKQTERKLEGKVSGGEPIEYEKAMLEALSYLLEEENEDKRLI